MSNKTTDSNDLKALLSTYSLEDITALFSGIDEKIVSLHQVSSEDFSNLNHDFKEFHGEARHISNNVTELFQIITGSEHSELITGIEQLYQELKSNTEVLDCHTEVITEALTRLLSRLRQSFFPLKNFKQNLTSLKFLETNYELNLPLDENRQVHPMAVQDACEKLKAQLSLIEVMLSRLKQLIKEHFSLKDQFNAEREDIANILNRLKAEVEAYTNHYNKIREHLPAIKTETDRSAENISGIITNLQYQDIIKQKMEHIQQTHKQLLEESGALDDPLQEDTDETKARYFIRIRDVAGLQAAQLMHTNKEYQSAIQKISDKFLEIGQSMTRVSALCRQYLAPDQGKPEFMGTLKKNLDGARKQINSFCRFRQSFADKMDEIRQVLDRLMEGQEKLNVYMDQLKESLDQTGVNVADPHHDDPLRQQMRQLHADLQSNRGLLGSIFSDYSQIRRELDPSSMTNLYGKSQENRELPERIRQYLDRLGAIEGQVVQKIKENNEKGESIYTEVQNSVNRIKYYDYFENVIGEIIEELNTVNYNLKLFSSGEGESKEDNLRQLRDYYTMNTEFVIHEQVSRGEAPDVEIEEEGGDLELF